MTDQAWPRFGAFSYDFGGSELDRLVDEFSAAGLTAVQWGKELLDTTLDNPDTIPSTVAKLDAVGIEVVGLAGYRNLVAADETRRRDNVAYIARCLEIAPGFGAPVVATETGTRNPDSDWVAHPDDVKPETWALLYAAFDELLPIAEQHRSILALEAYVNNVLRTQDQLADLLERFPTPALQVVLDPFNFLSADLLPRQDEATTELFDRFADRFVIAHLKDVSPEGAEVDTPAFGKGVFNFALYAELLRSRRPDLPIIHEHLPFADVPAASDGFRRAAGGPA